MSRIITGSPDISVLDFTILYDISQGIPAITLTNASVGVPSGTTRLQLCTWWYVITSPNGTPIHSGSVTSPDQPPASSAWTTLSIAPLSWPTPMGTPPCGQIEFSCAVPYVCTLYVKDTLNATYSLAISTTICRPNGSTSETCGSFGAASAIVKTQCDKGKIQGIDSTDYTYQGIVGTSSGSIWTLRYPENASGVIPSNGTVTNAPYALFDIGSPGKGYSLYLNTTAIYDMGNGSSVKVQYKLYDEDGISVGVNFAVYCNIDLCKLDCKMQEFYDLLNANCGEVMDPSLPLKVQKMQLLYSRVLTGIFLPTCGIDVPAIIEEMERIGGFQCDCACGGLNIGIINSGTSGSCCPITANIIDEGTDLPPAACPGSYFPVQVKDPTYATVIGSANNINDLIALVNATPAWQAYGTAFAEGNCKVGWFLANPTGIPPEIHIVAGGTVIPPSGYIDEIIDINTDLPPVGCPAGSPYPVRVYNPAFDTVIGIANSIAEVVSILNSNVSWAAYGVASVLDTCHVQFNLTDPSTLPPVVKVDLDVTGTDCQSDEAMYLVYMVDPCFPLVPITASSFPCNATVDWGAPSAGVRNLGLVADFAALVTALNAQGQKPASVTIYLGTVPNSLRIYNSDCTAYPSQPVITCNAGSNNYILFGANHTDESGGTVAAIRNGEVAFGLANNLDLGRIAGSDPDKHMFHTIYVGGYAITAEGDTGKVYFYDMTDARNPVLSRVIQLNDTGSGDCFSGLPLSANFEYPSTPKPSIYSLHFPTDPNSNLSLGQIPIVEGTTGSIWLVDFYTGAVVDSDANTMLLGKCPRVCTGANTGGVIFFSQDGNLEAAAGLSSGIAVGDIPVVTFDSSGNFGYAAQTIFASPESVWSASFDGVQYIHFVGINASVYSYPVFGVGSIITNTHILGSSANFQYRLNSACFGGVLYFAPIRLESGSPPTRLTMRTVTTASLLASSPVISTISLLANIFNVTQIGGCMMAITVSGSTLHIYKTDGSSFVDITITQGTGYVASVYNVIAIPGYRQYTPNTFVNP